MLPVDDVEYERTDSGSPHIGGQWSGSHIRIEACKRYPISSTLGRWGPQLALYA